MNILWFLIGMVVGGVVGGIVGWVIKKPQTANVGPIDASAAKHAEIMAKAKEFLKDKTEITNDLLQAHLGVSNASAERYLDELEAGGLIKQIGKTGTAVTYTVL